MREETYIQVFRKEIHLESVLEENRRSKDNVKVGYGDATVNVGGT